MKHLKLFAALLLSVLLLCSCAPHPAISDKETAAECLTAYLHDFVYSEGEDYSCEFQDAQVRDGVQVYRFEAFWEENGEKYSLGIFSVYPDGTVTPDE